MRRTSPGTLRRIPRAVFCGGRTHHIPGWRSQYVYHFCDRSQTLSGHISITKMIHNKNSSDLSWGTVPQSIAGEFLLWIILFIEISSLKV